MVRRQHKVRVRARSSVPDKVVKGLERLTVDKEGDDEEINRRDIGIGTGVES